VAKLSKLHKKLLSELEGIYSEMDTFLDDETVSTVVKSFGKLKDKLGDIVQSIEDGEYEEVEEEKEDMDGEKDAD
jgi:predicted thioredoxin/glutaredoxin